MSYTNHDLFHLSSESLEKINKEEVKEVYWKIRNQAFKLGISYPQAFDISVERAILNFYLQPSVDKTLLSHIKKHYPLLLEGDIPTEIKTSCNKKSIFLALRDYSNSNIDFSNTKHVSIQIKKDISDYLASLSQAIPQHVIICALVYAYRETDLSTLEKATWNNQTQRKSSLAIPEDLTKLLPSPFSQSVMCILSDATEKRIYIP